VAIASAGIPQALDPLEVMAIYLKGLHIQRLHAETGAVGPAREAMGAAQQMEDATRLIPLASSQQHRHRGGDQQVQRDSARGSEAVLR